MNQNPPRRSGAALWGLILSIVGLCFLPAGIAGLILGIVGLSKIKKDPALLGRGLAIGAIVIGSLCFFAVGIEAAIAIHAFQGYLGRSKALEAQTQVAYIARAAASYYEVERPGPGHSALVHQMPPTIPRTPATPACGLPAAWPPTADPGWALLDFQPMEPLRYAYELEVAPTGGSFIARAVGDLDCDGQLSRFEVAGIVQGGSVVIQPIVITDETE